MAKFEVHVYAIVRVKVENVEANTAQEATGKAEESLDLNEMFNGIPNAEYADDVDGFLVDEVGDDQHANSKWFDKKGRQIQP